jgi:hypothetical protein
MSYKIIVPITINGSAEIDCTAYELGDKGVTYWPNEDKDIMGFIPYGTFGAILPVLPEVVTETPVAEA